MTTLSENSAASNEASPARSGRRERTSGEAPGRSWPKPVPMGWYSAGYGHEFETGQVAERRFVGRDLVVWREADGTPHVVDAYCPHLGAHLAYGGCVDGDRIVCPFHHWAYDAEGTNVDIPYVERTNAKARLRTFPTVERNHMVMFWYHPDPDVPPRYDVPELEALAGSADASVFVDTDEIVVETAWQEIAENAVDGAHFQYVHGTDSPGTVAFADFSGIVRHQKVDVNYNTKYGPIEGWQENWTYGPGLGVVHFHIVGDAFLITSNTPIEADRTHVRFAWVYADDDLSRLTGSKFAEEVKRQFRQDIPIWEHKRFLADPALASVEKPIMQFRKWAERFYPGSATEWDGIADSGTPDGGGT